jgi:hypothetical protein
MTYYIPKISLAIKKYIKIPNTSLLVVIKGPVATAGSMPRLSKKIGTKVPIKAAITITAIKAMQIVKDSR